MSFICPISSQPLYSYFLTIPLLTLASSLLSLFFLFFFSSFLLFFFYTQLPVSRPHFDSDFCALNATYSAKIEKSELKVLARKRHSSGISGSESVTRSGVSSAGSSSVPGVIRVNSSGTDSTNTSYRSNMNSFDKEEGLWTETEGSHEEYNSSFKPRKFSNKAELNFRSLDVNLSLPKKKLSYIFEQSSDERLCDNKNTKSQSLIHAKSIGEKTAILDSHDRNYMSTETTTTSTKSNNNNYGGNNNGNNNNNGSNSNNNSNNCSSKSNNTNNYFNNNTAHNNQFTNPHSTNFNLKGGSSTDLRNLKGAGSSHPSLSSGPVNSTQSSMIDTVESRYKVSHFPIIL